MDHTVEEIQLKCGTKGLLIDIPATHVMQLVVSYNSGLQFGDFSKYELPHVLEHLMGCGSINYPKPNQFKAAVEKNGGFRNAHTGIRFNSYDLEFPDFELDRILDLLEEYQVRPIFPPEALPTELSNVREELTRNTTQYANVLETKLATKTHPNEYRYYDERIRQLPSISIGDIRDYYQRTHTAHNARFYLAGPIGAARDRVVERLETIFGLLPVGERFVPAQNAGLAQPSPLLISEKIDAIYYKLIGFTGAYSEHERATTTLLRFILGVGWESRIYAEARRRGLAYSVGVIAGASEYDASFGFEGHVTPNNIEPLFELFASATHDIKTNGVGNQELAAAKTYLIGTFKRLYQTTGDILGWYWSRYDREGVIRSPDEFAALIQSVKPEMIQNVLAKLTSGDQTATGFLGDIDKLAAERYHQLAQSIWQ